MNEKDKELFLEDFRKADILKKLDIWYFALEQEILWEEILAQMSDIAQVQDVKQDQSMEK